MSGETSLPWNIWQHTIYSRETDGAANYAVAICELPQDAALIVRAVNSHEAMKEALRDAKQLIQAAADFGFTGVMGGESGSSVLNTRSKINAALALAEGK